MSVKQRVQNFYAAMLKPENGDLAVGITILIAIGFLLGISVVK